MQTSIDDDVEWGNDLKIILQRSDNDMQLAADDEGNYDHNQNLNARKIQTKASDVGHAISMSSQEHGE